jgi:transcriptional regulator with XRE-family HTH domain
MAAKKRQYILVRRYTDLGEYLQKMRTRSGLTQREVSLELGYSSAQFISNFERGIAVPPLKKLKTLVRMYDMSAETVMGLILDAEREHLISVLKPKMYRA